MSFTHLHVTTTFSPGHGTAAPAELAAAAAMQGATALACTDHDGLYGAVDHLVACRAHGLAPLLGVSLAVLEPDDGRARGRASGRVVVLAHGGGEGYRALCRLVADAHVHTAGRAGTLVPPGATRQELAARAVDPGSGTPLLTVLLGPESDVGLAMQGPRYLRPRTLFKEWLAAMPTGTVAAEAVSHHTGPGSTVTTGQSTSAHFTTAHAARMLKLAREHHIPAILSNAVRHLSAPAPAPQETPARESPVQKDPVRKGPIQEGPASTPSSPHLALAPAGRDLRPPAGTQAFLKNISEMEQTARGICHAADLRVKDLEQLLEDTHRLAETCRLDPATDLGWGTALLPEATVLGLTMAPQAELAERCQTALERRVSGLSAAEGLELREHAARELDVIETRGAASFYLAAADVTATIRGLGIRVSGRSWTTASVVARLLGISAVDPLGLPTESGLPLSASAAAPEGTVPDVFPPLELDLEAGGLREVHRALARRFGKDRVCLLGSAPAVDPGPEASPLLAEAGTLVEVSDPSGTLPGGLSRRSSG
ncbi:MAG: PHP domain-containing protein, partial [Arthrobacter sp.]|nr:PHP domain-containing protein [Arthrobacter sp.]